MAKVEKSSKVKVTVSSSKTSTAKLLFVVGLSMFVISGMAWFYFVRSNPENTFNGMLANGFRTASVTRQVQQDSGSQKLDQVIRLQNQTTHTAHGYTTLTQKTGNKTTTVVTESIGTPSADFVRYTSISTGQKDTKGKELQFGKVLNVWGKSEVDANESLGNLYGDTALGLFLFADLPSSQSKELMNTIAQNNVYQTNYNAATKITENGRPYYVYRVSVKPSAYIELLKQFGADVGLTQLTKLDAKNYENADPLVFNVTVDILSQRLAKISAISAARTETFNGYGIIDKVELPTNTITLPELQERLQASTSV